MDEMVSVTITGTTTHPDAPEDAIVFTAVSDGAPVVFYMPHDAGEGLKSFLRVVAKGDARPMNINADYFLQ
jgi:hypothetical protein